MGPEAVPVDQPAWKKTTPPRCLQSSGQTKSIRLIKKNNLHFVLSKETAANAFGMDGKSVAENLVKINVYYTSLNEKIIQDEIVFTAFR